MLIKEKRSFYLEDFAVSRDHRVKIKESKKIAKYVDLDRELKKTVIHKEDSDAYCS